MRKGADCLSKWVGESERQLRLLFDQVMFTVVQNVLEEGYYTYRLTGLYFLMSFLEWFVFNMASLL